MRVVVPYTTTIPEVDAGLAATGWPVERAFVGDSETSYWALLAGLWTARETFCIVEHDVVIRPDTLDELATCPETWCAFPIPYVGQLWAGMGCVKFGTSAIAGCPDALDRVATYSDDRHPPRHWCTLDAVLQGALAPQPKHLHEPVLGHWRANNAAPWPAHGCHL